MDQSTQRSERLTAILSTLVAIAILAAGVTAQQSHSERADELAYLESDLRFQLQSAYRLNPKAAEPRLEQLESVLAAWQASPRSETDRRRLATWLLEATIRSMPGSLEPLPESPQFGMPEPTADAAAAEPIAAEPAPLPDDVEIVAATSKPTPAPPATKTAPDLAQPHGSKPDPAPSRVEHSLVSVAVEPHVTAAPAVAINLAELTARIAGYHQGVRELESTLVTDERPQVERVTAQVDLLESLAQDFQFVQLYYDALSDDERRAIESPQSLESVTASLRQQLNRLQSDLEADFLGEYDSDLGERIAELRGRIEAIASRTAW